MKTIVYGIVAIIALSVIGMWIMMHEYAQMIIEISK